MLKDYELNGKTIHSYIIRDHYAARARNLKAYDAISKDVISRWTYPLCPDTNLLPGHTYELRKSNLYQEQGVTLARSCVVGRRTVIGQGTSIGEKTTVKNTVLGRNCKIGKNVTLDSAYIWDGAVVGDGTSVCQAVIADGVGVGKDCKVEPGALLSYGVKIADGVTVSEGRRITKFLREDEEVPENDPAVVGAGGEGYEFTRDEDEEDEEDDASVASSGLGMIPSFLAPPPPPHLYQEELTCAVYNMANLSLSTESVSTLSSEVSDFGGSRAGSMGTSVSEEDQGDHFIQDAAVSLYDSLRDGVTPDVVQLELVSLRMTANASDNQVRRAVVSAFMKRIQQIMDGGRGAGEAVRDIFGTYREIVERCMFDRDSTVKTDQVDLLLLLQQDLITRPRGDTVLLFTAKELYDLELLEEEAYEQWWEDERSSNSEDLKKVRTQAQQFVDWLANAEEEESSEGEEESDEE